MSLLTPDLVSFLEGPNSMMVASRDAALVPAIARAVALFCAPDGQHVTVVLPDAPAARVLAQLAGTTDGGRVALVTELSATHRTIQLKGQVVAMSPTSEAERAAVEAKLEAWFGQLEQIGLPRKLTERLTRWPSTSVRVRVEQVFEQSPGPGAG